MSNKCTNEIVVYSLKKEELEKFLDKIKPSFDGEEHWVIDVVPNEIDITDYRSFESYICETSIPEINIVKNIYFIKFNSFSYSIPDYDFWNSIIDDYNEYYNLNSDSRLMICSKSKEPNNNIYTNTDLTGLFFPEFYSFDIYIKEKSLSKTIEFKKNDDGVSKIEFLFKDDGIVFSYDENINSAIKKILDKYTNKNNYIKVNEYCPLY